MHAREQEPNGPRLVVNRMPRRVQTGFAILLGLCGMITMAAQAPAPGANAGPLRTPEELDEIFAPIALYPDPLVAMILPAATVPADVANAAHFVATNGDPSQIDGQPWDPSVKALTHFPDVLKWMNENIAWTQQAGEAFLAQPADVMKSIQQLRARAIASGALVNTPQQQVITDGNEIRIIPAQPDVVYVPSYDPDLVYDEQPGYNGPWLTFGPAYPEGIWFGYDLDWDRHGIWIGQWHRGWDYRHPPWHGPDRGGAAGHSWRPNPGPRPRNFEPTRSHAPVVHPQPFQGAQGRPAPARAPSRAPVVHPFAPAPQVRPDLRGYPAAGPGRAPAEARPAPEPSTVFGGYNRGSDARAASERGQESRREISAPARAPAPQPRSEPQRAEPQRSEPAPSGGRDPRHP